MGAVMAAIYEFVLEYTRAIREGYAAVFAGAGLSRESGYVNWKELVKPFAKTIGLEVEKEHDLISITQYYLNEKRTRGSINQSILNEFTKNATVNENIEILARLPIQTYWTTNYDEVIEKALSNNNKKADVKITQNSLATNIYDRDAVVYKMHGTVLEPDQAVITKDDYETYGTKRPLFRTALQGDLIGKTFLFIGFSFEDPNLDYVLSQIRSLLGEQIRDHYCFFERVKKARYTDTKEYDYDTVKQQLRINDLKRYGINAILLDTYAEITGILKQIESSYLRNSVFISGSIEEYSSQWPQTKAIQLGYSLAKKLVENDYRIISGFGLGIGSSVINGALDEIMSSKYKHVEEHLCLRPFPQYSSGGSSQKKQWTSYREDMIGLSGIAIFMFGNKKVDDQIKISEGMIEEFTIAASMGKVIIPVGSTGWAAKEIYENVKSKATDYPYLSNVLKQLDNEEEVDKLIDIIMKVVREVNPC